MLDPTTAAHSSGPSKICVICGRDCAGRPRSKDAHGRYVCGDCAKAARQRTTTPPANPLRSAPAAVATLPDDPDIIPLADEDGLGPAAEGSDQTRTCPNCRILLARNAVICTACGLDTRTGHLLAGPQEKGRTCIQCGYSLRGLKSDRCPECGALNSTRGRKAHGEAKAARDTVREAYTKPLIMFAGGLGVSIAAAMIGAGSANEGLLAAAAYLLKYAIYVPTGVAVFLACCLFWMGFDAPIHLIALRLAAVYAVTDAVGVFVAFIPLGIIQLGIMVIVYVGLLQDLLELDLSDAILVGVITFAVRAIMFMFLLAWVSGLLGA